MKVCAVSDLHGFLPKIPECDLFLIAGDICGPSNIFSQMKELINNFKPWLANVQAKKKIIVAGNHDIIFQTNPELLPVWDKDTMYLQDDGCEFEGLKIYGSPWQIRFCDWAFNEDEENLEHIWSKIPDDTDILVTHSPPLGYGDINMGRENLGSPSLTRRVLDIEPKLHCWGHIHYSYGVHYMPGYKKGQPIIGANVALCGENYKPINQIQEFTL